MSVLVTVEAADILYKIGDLCLRDIHSDVEFVVDGLRLPAHQIILCQRCPVFKAMFSTNCEFEKQVIEVLQTSLDPFKLFMKFIYTGTVELCTVNVGTVFDVASIAKTYEMPRLIEHCIEHLKSICAVDNVVNIINKAIEKSQETLVDCCINYVCAHYADIIVHGNFDKLPINALYRVLEKPTSEVSAHTIFHACVGWMKANNSESEHFPELLKRMDLTSMKIDKIVGTLRPLNIVDANVLLDLACDHAKKASNALTHPLEDIFSHFHSTREKSTNVENPGSNVLTADSNTVIVEDQYPSIWQTLMSTKLKHTICSDNKHITIDLDRLRMLNKIEFYLAYGDWSYWIEVSKNNVNWTRIIDYSKYTCRSFQRLYFKTQWLRYIRICGTAPVGRTFEVRGFLSDYTFKPLEVDRKTNLVIPSQNVALAEYHTVLTQGECYKRNGMISISRNGYSFHAIGKSPIIVQLPQPYILDSMNLSLIEHCLYDYNIEVSTDNINWTRVFSEEKVTSRRHVKFAKQPVVFIKLTGTYSTSAHFFCERFECSAITNS
uniref:BTB domain-containing protein n=1 Tax=Panagrellus redivivus TaxID=6233 RepID=A0A7E4VHN1_PANRE